MATPKYKLWQKVYVVYTSEIYKVKIVWVAFHWKWYAYAVDFWWTTIWFAAKWLNIPLDKITWCRQFKEENIYQTPQSIIQHLL